MTVGSVHEINVRMDMNTVNVLIVRVCACVHVCIFNIRIQYVCVPVSMCVHVCVSLCVCTYVCVSVCACVYCMCA